MSDADCARVEENSALENSVANNTVRVRRDAVIVMSTPEHSAMALRTVAENVPRKTAREVPEILVVVEIAEKEEGNAALAPRSIYRFKRWIDSSTFGIGLTENRLPYSRLILEFHEIGFVLDEGRSIRRRHEELEDAGRVHSTF